MMQQGEMQAMLQALQESRKPLIEFKAGLLNQTGNTVAPDPRRGKVTVIMGNDGLLHLQWTQRPNGRLDSANDIILVRGDNWTKVPECKTGRVYMLKQSGRKRFFWMQEEKDDKDEEIAANLNKFIKYPPSSEFDEMGLGGGPPLGGGDVRPSFLELIGQAGDQAAPSRRRPAVCLGAPPATSTRSGVAPTSSPTASGAGPQTGAAAPINVQDFSQALMELLAARTAENERLLMLNPVLEADRVLPHLQDEKTLAQLYPFLPESQRNSESVRQTLRSPQLAQTLTRMSQVLNGPQFVTVMTSLGLRPGSDFGVSAFLNGILESEGKQPVPSPSSSSSAFSSSNSATSSSTTSSISSSTTSSSGASSSSNSSSNSSGGSSSSK